MLTRRAALALGASAALAVPRLAAAQSAEPVIRIGMLQDRSGPYSYLGGATAEVCARQAAAEFAAISPIKVEIITADHQNKPDLAIAIARDWIANGVDALMEFNNSAVALAANSLIRDKDKVMLANGAGTPLLSGKECTPNMTHWVFDTAMLAKSLGTALFQEGGDTWFYIHSDYVFGRALRDSSAAVVKAAGGKVVGEVAVPLGTTDFSSALLAAQASGSKVVALGMAGADLLNCLKQAAEFGLTRSGQKVAALIVFINDIETLGLATTQGTLACETFYWDLSDRSRAFTKRVIGKTGGVPPNMSQAGSYSAVRHYLKAVAAMGAADAKRSGRDTVARMKAIPVEDDVLVDAHIRPDGRVVSDAYVFEMKSVAESTSKWDLYKLRATLGPDQAWRSMADGGCPLVKS